MGKEINYLSVTMAIILLSFVLYLFNHMTILQINLASDDAKILTLGLTKKSMIKQYWKNQSFIFLILILVSSIVFFLIYLVLEDFILIFNVYEQIHLTFKTFNVGFSINLLIFVLIMSYQSYLIAKIKQIDYITIY